MIAKERWNFVAVLADGEMEGICERRACLQEICQIHSNSYGLLDCRHGPMVLFGSGLSSPRWRLRHHASKTCSRPVRQGCHSAYGVRPSCELPGVASIPPTAPSLTIVRGLAVLIVCQYASY